MTRLDLDRDDLELVRVSLVLYGASLTSSETGAVLDGNAALQRHFASLHDRSVALASMVGRLIGDGVDTNPPPVDGDEDEMRLWAHGELYPDDGPPDDSMSESEARYYAGRAEDAEERQREASGW